jgi:hypothetical protein
MAIDSKHKDYLKLSPIWERCEDAVKGQDAIHDAGEKYLPRLKDQTDDEYKAYKGRATFFNATGRTVDGLVGMVTRKAPVIEAVAGFNAYSNDVDLQGSTINEMIEHILREVIITNRFGCLVEYPQGVVSATKAQVEKLNIRPYITTYDADDILDWRLERVNNVMQPVYITLQECAEVMEGDELKEIPQIRALHLEKNVYLQRIWQKPKDKDWVQVDEITPLMNGKPLNYIPFVLFGQAKKAFKSDLPIIYDLVNVNIAHCRVTADYEHGCHFTGLPTPVISGYRPNEKNPEKFYIGSTAAWVFPDKDAKAQYLEFSGQGLDSLVKNLESKEKQMAVLGAKIIEQQKSGVEAENTIRLRASGENSALANIAGLVSKQLTKLFTIMGEWAGIGAVTVSLNKDYYPVSLSADDIIKLVQAWQGGGISKHTLRFNLREGEVYPDGWTDDDEEEALDNALPNLVG